MKIVHVRWSSPPAEDEDQGSYFSLMEMWEIELEAIGFCCRVRVGRDNELLLDLDDPVVSSETWNFISRLESQYHAHLPTEETRSKSGNTHLLVTLPVNLSVPERVCLQILAGSDPGREWAALSCHWRGSEHPILFYEPLPKLLPASVDVSRKCPFCGFNFDQYPMTPACCLGQCKSLWDSEYMEMKYDYGV